jgi:RNA polymerase-binding transcription factor DksA
MNGMGTAVQEDRLLRRRRAVELTLRHLENERRRVVANTHRMDRNAYVRRLRLLDHLTRWYRTELGDIEKAMNEQRIRYGRCIVCHESIDADRAEIQSDADLCWDCFEYRETLRG